MDLKENKVGISEIFYSIQGEGVYSGVPMTFIRFQFCPFRCSWCDSEYTWPKEKATLAGTLKWTVEDLVSSVTSEWVCITGGEPLAQPESFSKLITSLGCLHQIEVETSGLVSLPCFWSEEWAKNRGLNRPFSTFSSVRSWVVDIKCPASGESEKNYFKNLGILRPSDQVKCVIQDRNDFDYALNALKEHPTKATILFSPVANEMDPRELATWVQEDYPVGRLSLQIHKFLQVR